MTLLAGASQIPRIDRNVEHVGVSKLRKLNSDDLKTMDKTLVLQENDQPLAVLLTYEKYLVLQDQMDGLMRTIITLSNPEECALFRTSVNDLKDGKVKDLREITDNLKRKK